MEVFILICVGIFGSLLSFYTSVHLKQGPIRSSASLTMLVAGFLYFFPELLSPYLTKNIPYVFIGSSFIGMVSSGQLSSYLGLGLAGLIFTFIFLNTSRFFDGFGGALGTSACVSLLAVMSIPYLKTNRKVTIGFLQLRRFVLKNKKRRIRKAR
ncbi:hypothetical protein ACR79M_02750 [Sphingobacterium spiritivorum]|uniref:hypothetical protein n=1 Tax=Sphingobacterium TaxID=28453 RepID=UPI0025EA3062|nr:MULTISPECIES: hypothetical protein [unclassified Sphingobacterium]